MLKPMNIIFIGAIIIVIGGLIGAIGSLLHNRQSSKKTDRIEIGVKSNTDVGKLTNKEIMKLKNQNNDLQKKVDEFLLLTSSKIINQSIEQITPAKELKPAFITNPLFISNTVGLNNKVTITDLFSYRCVWISSEVLFLVKVANEETEYSFTFGKNTVYPFTIIFKSLGKTCLIQVFNKTDASFQVKTYSD